MPISSSASSSENIFNNIASALEKEGYCVLAQVLEPALTDVLARRVHALPLGQFKRAGIGRQSDHQLNQAVRSDEICWLNEQDPAERAYLHWMEQLRQALNRRLFLGLFDYECHFAHYPPGAYYTRHVDAFRGSTNRLVSTVFYLNPDWQAAAGGELIIYAEHGTAPLATVRPLYGTLVVFLSDQFPHEVMKTQRDRYSIAGWFRVNTSHAGISDPPA